jgi:hypothetical protein
MRSSTDTSFVLNRDKHTLKGTIHLNVRQYLSQLGSTPCEKQRIRIKRAWDSGKIHD